MPHKRRHKAARNVVPKEQLAAARDEATLQIRQRDELRRRESRLRDLEVLERVFGERDHPAWWAVAFAMLPLLPENENAGLWEAVQEIIDKLVEPMSTGIASARGLTAVPTLWAKESAKAGESLPEATERVLLGQGHSSYAIVRAIGDHQPNMHSAGLPQADVRRMRRKGQTLRADAEAKLQELAKVSLPKPETTDSLSGAFIEGMIGWFEGRRSAAEAKQAAIVANLDRPQRRRKAAKGRP